MSADCSMQSALFFIVFALNLLGILIRLIDFDLVCVCEVIHDIIIGIRE